MENSQQSIDLRTKSMDWFLYDNGVRHESVKWIATSIEKYWIRIAQCSILTSLFFMIYIDDLSDDMKASSKIFTDDIPFFCSSKYQYICD